ncbi:MAG: hypothetical protein HQL39_08590, partial [Alphaproteobacteria bacterium]|nr:hypothetical protein [Alphaproteobacteria bacterium]
MRSAVAAGLPPLRDHAAHEADQALMLTWLLVPAAPLGVPEDLPPLDPAPAPPLEPEPEPEPEPPPVLAPKPAPAP